MQFELPENLNLKIRDGDALLSLDSSKNGMVCLCQRPLINGDGRHPVSNATISAHQCIQNQMRHRPGSRPLFLASWQRLSGRQTCTLFLATFRNIHTYLHSHVHTHRHSCMRRAIGPDLNAFPLYVCMRFLHHVCDACALCILYIYLFPTYTQTCMHARVRCMRTMHACILCKRTVHACILVHVSTSKERQYEPRYERCGTPAR